MIESGSHTAGVSAEDFGLPPNTALRYEQPAAALRRHLPSYVVLDSENVGPSGTAEWMLPSWAQIWVVITDRPITVRIGSRRYDPVSSAILYGVTSRAMPVLAHGGVTIGIDVSPLGWARFFSRSAETLRDRITPLADIMPPAAVNELVARLHGSDRALEVKQVLDDFFLRHLPDPNPDEPIVAEIMRLIVDDETLDLSVAAAGLGIDIRTLRRLSKRYFGFPPRMLMMRTRFLRSFLAMLGKGGRADYSLVGPDYHDLSHFTRDAKRFLGMTPRQFMAMDTPYLEAALRARNLVFGVPTPSLDRSGSDTDG
ncbi:MAG: hypothetical protein JWN66_1900 [Sphingomonas bacterium]|uniref:helix-turn-helix domain-containing protein n=1 Tax=Sphingomonas bacterium TaxID=1895847 RepID=UPI00261EEA61|nr:helix-turn-helix domain-containing protein [Sphingomonas bacterium]MDB5704784.1 hypothetical protein [Sphingomonas bacterium]